MIEGTCAAGLPTQVIIGTLYEQDSLGKATSADYSVGNRCLREGLFRPDFDHHLRHTCSRFGAIERQAPEPSGVLPEAGLFPLPSPAQIVDRTNLPSDRSLACPGADRGLKVAIFSWK